MRVKYWLTGAAAGFIVATAAMGAQAAPTMPGIKAAAGETTVAEPAYYWRRYYRRYAVPYLYWGPRYRHRRHWRDYGYFYRPYYRRYWR